MLLDGAQLNRMTRACEVCEEPRAHRTPQPGEGQRARGTGPQKTPRGGQALGCPSPRLAGAEPASSGVGAVRSADLVSRGSGLARRNSLVF